MGTKEAHNTDNRSGSSPTSETAESSSEWRRRAAEKVSAIDISTQSGATNAILSIDAALIQIEQMRLDLLELKAGRRGTA